MPFPLEDRFKNLQEQIANQAEPTFDGHSIEDSVFHGVVKEVVKDSYYTYAYLKVTPYDPYDPPQDGSLVFEKLGDDPLADATSDARYDKVYVINLAPQLVYSYFQPGQRITYWHYSGVGGDNTQLIRGSYVTLWVGPNERILHLTGGNPGSGVYSANIMTGEVQISAAADLSMPAGMSFGGQAVAINLDEDGTTGSHQIATPCYVVGTLCGSTTATAGNPTYPVFAIEPASDTFWAKLNASTTASPFRYGWVEQQLAGGSFSDKPGGRSGTTSSNFAVNAVDPGFYGEVLLDITPEGVYVRMTSKNNTNMFDSPPILRCGYARVDGATANYGLSTPTNSQRTTSHLELWPDDFKIVRSTDTAYLRRDTDTTFLWLGFDAKMYDGSPVGGGPFKVLQLKDPGGAGAGNPYDVYWTAASNSSPRTAPATSPLNIGNLEVSAKVYVPLLKVSGCGTAAADTKTIAFGQGLSVSNGGNTASVSLDLAAGTNIKIEDYGCQKKISVDPIVTKTFVTGISATAACNGDGTITVTITTTTDTIKGLG